MTPKYESEMLMNAMFPVFEGMLKQYAEFYPFGGCMNLDGSIMHIGATDPETDRPKSRDLLFVLKESVRELARSGECEAIALVFDVSITLPNSAEKSDAIQINIEHASGYSVEVIFPYRLTDNGPIYGETLVQQGRHEFFCAT